MERTRDEHLDATWSLPYPFSKYELFSWKDAVSFHVAKKKITWLKAKNPTWNQEIGLNLVEIKSETLPLVEAVLGVWRSILLFL